MLLPTSQHSIEVRELAALHPVQLPVNMPVKASEYGQVPKPLEEIQHSWLVASVWSSTDHCGHLESESAGGKYISH